MMMRTSENYNHEFNCPMDECERHYCHTHRMLWRDCDTAIKDWDGSGRQWWALKDCPACEKEERFKQYIRMAS